MGGSSLLTFKTNEKIGKYESCTLYAPDALRRLLPFLNEHYSDEIDAINLIRGGNISSLGEVYEPDEDEEHSFDNPQRGVTVYYGRDRGEKGQQSMRHQSWDMAIDSGDGYQSCLIYSGGRWDVTEHENDETEPELRQFAIDMLTWWDKPELVESIIDKATPEFFESYREQWEQHKKDQGGA